MRKIRLPGTTTAHILRTATLRTVQGADRVEAARQPLAGLDAFTALASDVLLKYATKSEG